jgi:glucosamine--fructose-6-phosphate aminotransferase (isomerizing)
MTIVRDEIAEQPEVVERLLTRQSDAFERLSADIARRPPRFVATAARGTSDNAARYAQFVFGWMLRLPVGLATPSLHTVYGTPPRYHDTLVIGISQSGASPDVVSVVESAAEQGCTTVAITNEPGSPMGAAAGHVIDLGAGTERAVAATKTYTASLAAVAGIATAVLGDPVRRDELARVPEHMARQLELADTSGAVDLLATWTRGAVVGRGANYGTVFEIALKIKELAGVAAEPYSPADLLHGPVAVAGSDYPVIAVAPSGPARASVLEALADTRRRGAPTVILADDPSLAPSADVRQPLTPTAEWLSPLVAVLPGQLLAVGLAEDRGLDVDHPFGLSKVTRTT